MLSVLVMLVVTWEMVSLLYQLGGSDHGEGSMDQPIVVVLQTKPSALTAHVHNEAQVALPTRSHPNEDIRTNTSNLDGSYHNLRRELLGSVLPPSTTARLGSISSWKLRVDNGPLVQPPLPCFKIPATATPSGRGKLWEYYHALIDLSAPLTYYMLKLRARVEVEGGSFSMRGTMGAT